MVEEAEHQRFLTTFSLSPVRGQTKIQIRVCGFQEEWEVLGYLSRPLRFLHTMGDKGNGACLTQRIEGDAGLM